MSFNKKEWMKEYRKKYINTPKGRASNLISAYNRADKLANRGKGDLTAQWIVENIFSKPCKCGKSGWQIIGCNRIDNSKPHTKDNVEPCCRSCNAKLYANNEGIENCIVLHNKNKKRVDQIDYSTGEVLGTYNSVLEASLATKIHKSSIAEVCRGERNKVFNYIFKYVSN